MLHVGGLCVNDVDKMCYYSHIPTLVSTKNLFHHNNTDGIDGNLKML